MSKWFTQEGMDTIMSLKGIERIRLLFSTVFPDTLPVENATYGRLNKDNSIAMLTIKVSDDVSVQTEGGDSDYIIVCGVSFNWSHFKCGINTKVGTVNEHEQEALRNLWAYGSALRKAYSLILTRYQAIGYDALDRTHRVLMIIDQVLVRYMEMEDVLSSANREINDLIVSETRIWNKGTFDRMLSRYVITDTGHIQRETDPESTVTVLSSMYKHGDGGDVVVIEDHVSDVKPIVKVFDLKVSYTYINDQLNEIIEQYGLDATKVKKPLVEITKGMLLTHLYQKHVDAVGTRNGLNNIKSKMVRLFACGHLDLVKPTLVRISEKASRLATEITK
nr:MAG TPA: hypothetical protein [Caudoviricetes sp.]